MLAIKNMVVNTSSNNFKTERAVNHAYYNDNDYKLNQTPQAYNNSWYVQEINTLNSQQIIGNKTEPSCCKCLPRGEPQTTMRYNDGQQSATNMVASYGVYNHNGQATENGEDGFIPRSNAYHGVVVNASGGASVLRPTEALSSDDNSCGWCVSMTQSPSATASEETCWMSWCRPTLLLLILVLLIVVFVLVSGVLLYLNCTLTGACFVFKC